MRIRIASVLVTFAVISIPLLPSCSGDKPADTVEASSSGGAASNGGGAEKAKLDPAAKAAAKAKRKAKKQFGIYCAACHGNSGAGDGPGAIALDPKPRDWTDAKWQASVTDENILAVIRDGGKAHGLSDSMAPNPMYRDNEAVLEELVALVRAYKK